MFSKYSRDHHLAGQASGRKPKAVFLTALCTAMVLNSPASVALENDRLVSPDKTYTQHTSSFGALTQKVPIEVPQYHGLEPSLSLSYSSSRVNSYGSEDVIGAGWRLNGLSRIKRGSPGMGTPFFNELDNYYMDGERLLTCQKADKQSAGCQAGATHTSWVENYLRIKRLQDQNLWQVTLKNGTVLEYAPVSTWGSYDQQNSEHSKQATEYEWLLSKRTDTLGRTVTYSYACQALPQCYISTISYANGSVRFHWAERPDPNTYGTGYMLGRVDKRLATIEVKSATAVLRAYKLEHIVSTTSGRSLLSKVTEYGRNAVITDGLIKSGSKLPSYQFTYKHDVFDQKTVDARQFDTSPNLLTRINGDFNGDRKADVASWISSRNLREGEGTCYVQISYSSEQAKTQRCAEYNVKDLWLKIRRQDLKKYSTPHFISDYKICVSISDERDRCYSYMNTSDGLYDKNALVADFDGDGIDDIISGNKQWFSRSTNQNWTGVNIEKSIFIRGNGLRTADFNGDGRADIANKQDIFIRFNGRTIAHEKTEFKARLSNGKSGFSISFSSPKINGTLLGDFNGDGLFDFIYQKSKYERQVFYSTGLKFISGPIYRQSEFKDNNTIQSLTGDLNGDGRSDFIANRNAHTRIHLKRGDSFHFHPGAEHSDFIRDEQATQLADVNGNGLLEIISLKKRMGLFFGYNANSYGSNASGPDYIGRATKLVSERPDMLIGVVLPSGGHLSASYTTYGGDPEDERWFPPVLTVLASLTEKPNSSQAFTTRFAYSGGRWDFDNRRFAGFKKIITTLPKLAGETKAPTVETTYRQDVSSVGKIAQQIWKDGNGTILRKQVEEYSTDNSKLPYTSLNT
ncbi:FG-GAP-like repeat-containing protein, partial [Pseudovibrio denitrificans]